MISDKEKPAVVKPRAKAQGLFKEYSYEYSIYQGRDKWFKTHNFECNLPTLNKTE